MESVIVAMDGFHGECWVAYGDVFCAFVSGRAVLHPFAGLGDEGLAGLDDGLCAVFGFDVERASEDDAVFVEFGALAGFDPAWGAIHLGDAEGLGVGIYAADILADELGDVAAGFDCGWFFDEGGHGYVLLIQ